MIEQSEALRILVAACPSFADALREHEAEQGENLAYVAAGAFARHLLALHQESNVSTFPSVAAAIERLHTEGSPWVQEFATIGVLEAVQNVWSNNNSNPEHFARFLLPESRRWWEGLKNFWSGQVAYVASDA